MDKQQLINSIKKFLILEQRKTNLTVNELRDYLTVKKTLFDFVEMDMIDEIKRLNPDDEAIANFVDDIINKKQKERQIVEELNNDYIEKLEILEEKSNISVLDEQETYKEYQDNNFDNYEEYRDDNYEKEYKYQENDQYKEEPIAIKEEYPQNNTIKTDKDNDNELHLLLNENLDDIVEEIKKIRSKSEERKTFEITIGNKFKIEENSKDKINITLPKDAIIQIQSSLLLDLYSKQFGMDKSEIEKIEKNSKVNEVIIYEDNDKVIENVAKQDETKEKSSKKRKSDKFKIIRQRVFINSFKFTKKSPKNAIELIHKYKSQFSNEDIEEAVAKILNVPIEDNHLFKGSYDINKLTPEKLYLLRVFAQLKFNGIIHALSKLTNLSEDEVEQHLISILKNEPEELITEFFSSKTYKKVHGIIDNNDNDDE